jgi:hypothetical protein
MTAQPLVLFEAGPDWRSVANPVTTAPDPVRDIVKGMTNVKHKLPVADVDDIPFQVRRWHESNPGVVPSSIDLVAHASAGRVSVGFSVRGVEVGNVGTSTEYYILDSNPKIYKVLGSLTLEVSTRVPLRLLGCNTATNVFGYGLDGRVLMIALANMLDCAVDGTTLPIGIRDFGPDGFKSPGALSRVVSDACVPVKGSYDPATCCLPQPPTPPPSDPPSLLGVDVGDASLVPSRQIDTTRGGFVGRAEVDKAWLDGLLRQFEQDGVAYPQGDGLLALVEVVVRLPGRQRLELIDTGRLLRWRRLGAPTVLFEQTRGAATAVRSGLAQALGVHAPWWCVSRPPRGA